MRFESVSDIYAANQKARERLLAVLADVSDVEADVTTDDEPWSVNYITEHVAIVNNGMAGICSKLVEKAKANGVASSTSLAISDKFYEYIGMMATRKAEAPERVKPTGGVPIAGSKERLDLAAAIFAGLREDFENLDLSEGKFPHPYFGDLTAVEWFALSGLHERRHIEQIERLLTQIRQ